MEVSGKKNTGEGNWTGNNEIMKKIINRADDEFTIWSAQNHIVPRRLDTFVSGYLAGVKVTKQLLEELFLEEFNKRVEHGFNNRSN